MIIDTSAMVAILYREPEAALFIQRIHDADSCRISVATWLELAMVIESQLGPDGMRRAEPFSAAPASPSNPSRSRMANWRVRHFSISARAVTRPG